MKCWGTLELIVQGDEQLAKEIRMDGQTRFKKKSSGVLEAKSGSCFEEDDGVAMSRAAERSRKTRLRSESLSGHKSPITSEQCGSSGVFLKNF